MRSEITLEGGSLTVCLRGEVYYARVWLRDFQKYVWRSVRTADIETAKSRARKYLYEVETKQEQGLPLQSKTVNAVIDDYVAVLEKDHLRGATKAGMLRQIKRVVKFWREFVGARSVETVGDKELKAYVPWRRDYYSRQANMPPETLSFILRIKRFNLTS